VLICRQDVIAQPYEARVSPAANTVTAAVAPAISELVKLRDRRKRK
jgi:hypothetical protein